MEKVQEGKKFIQATTAKIIYKTFFQHFLNFTLTI